MTENTNDLMWLWATAALTIVLVGGAFGKGYYGDVGVLVVGGIGAAVLGAGIVREMRKPTGEEV